MPERLDSQDLPVLTVLKFMRMVRDNDETTLRKYPTAELAKFMVDFVSRTHPAPNKLLVHESSSSGSDVENHIAACWNQFLVARTPIEERESFGQLHTRTETMAEGFTKFLWHTSSPRADFQSFLHAQLEREELESMGRGRQAHLARHRLIGILRGIREVDPKWADELQEQYPAKKI